MLDTLVCLNRYHGENRDILLINYGYAVKWIYV